MIYLALGTNIGDRQKNIETAFELLEEHSIHILHKSPIYESEPLGPQDQEKYFNMVIEVETELEPLELLQTIKEIENNMGRKKTIHWGPRIIDIDIILYNEIVIETDELTIPHKEMGNRLFVLQPLADIAREVVHPVSGERIQEMVEECEDKLQILQL